jgi:hypothetical protein
MIDILDQEQEQFMVDLETLSLETNACIVSIGATKFTLKDGIMDTFGINIDPFDSRTYGLHIDPDTVAWWRKQDPAISDMWKKDPQPLKEALTKFCLWFGGRTAPIWGNSPSFDCIVIKEAMKATGVPCPWNFRDECDYRTLGKLIQVERDEATNLHSSVDDAIYQTNHLLKILKS